MKEGRGFGTGGVGGELLPVHGFVLAGGKSSRMGVDKATLEFCGRPLVEIAVAKLKEFCADVSIIGDRKDLNKFAPVVRDERSDAGPGAGIEAGLAASSQQWAMFLPVDVPLVPAMLLRAWVEKEMAAERASEGALLRSCGAQLPWASHLLTRSGAQWATALLHRDCLRAVSGLMDDGVSSLANIFEGIRTGGGVVTSRSAEEFAPNRNVTALDLETWFSNLNTSSDFREAELWQQARAANEKPCGGAMLRLHA